MTRIISMINQKGGVGKTSCTLNIAYALMLQNKKVLCIDCDAQGSLTDSLDVPTNNKITLTEVLCNGYSLDDAIVTSASNLDIVPSDISLSNVEAFLHKGKESVLKKAMEASSRVSSYDYILIDCPPSLGLLSLNAICASRELFVVLTAEYLAVKGLQLLNQTVEGMERIIHRSIPVTGVIINLYQKRLNAHRSMRELLEEQMKGFIFKSAIRSSTIMNESIINKESVFTYAPKSAITEDFKNLAIEIINQETKR